MTATEDSTSPGVGRVLVVDDDEGLARFIVEVLTDAGHHAEAVSSAALARRRVEATGYDVVVTDLRMPGESGLDVVRDLKAHDPTMKVLVLTGYGSIATAVEAVRQGAVDYLTKPADVDQVLAAFDRAEGGQGDPEAFTQRPGTAPSLARVEWEHIQRVLHDCEGNITKAARILGIHRRSLQRKLAHVPPLR